MSFLIFHSTCYSINTIRNFIYLHSLLSEILYENSLLCCLVLLFITHFIPKSCCLICNTSIIVMLGAVNGMRPEGVIDDSCMQSREVIQHATHIMHYTTNKHTNKHTHTHTHNTQHTHNTHTHTHTHNAHAMP